MSNKIYKVLADNPDQAEKANAMAGNKNNFVAPAAAQPFSVHQLTEQIEVQKKEIQVLKDQYAKLERVVVLLAVTAMQQGKQQKQEEAPKPVPFGMYS